MVMSADDVILYFNQGNQSFTAVMEEVTLADQWLIRWLQIREGHLEDLSTIDTLQK